MDLSERIDDALTAAVAAGEGPQCPRRIASAIRYSVFPGGARIRPRLTLAVALACGDDDPAAADSAATALELLHCASLVHDDLPCFDNAATRRGRASVNRAFGERLAVLAGDALIVLAFQTLGMANMRHEARRAALVTLIARCVGTPGGIVAGQAWECESRIALDAYHRAKTGALFAGATGAGAIAAGADPDAWMPLGERLGEAYQLADDIRDVLASGETLGKPAGQDARLGRPNAIAQWGVSESVRRFQQAIDHAAHAIPASPGRMVLESIIRAESDRLLPQELLLHAA
jgi:geranylgeranyl diphosphate synthase type II